MKKNLGMLVIFYVIFKTISFFLFILQTKILNNTIEREQAFGRKKKSVRKILEVKNEEHRDTFGMPLTNFD